MIINVVGLGYIGLPTALTLAEKGYDIVGTDTNPRVIEKLKKGKYESDEPGLSELYNSAIQKQIIFSHDCIKADIYIIAVPTPFVRSNKKIDSSYLIDAVKGVLKVCNDECIIAIESTVSPGTIDRDIRPLVSRSSKIRLAHVPERIIPGRIIEELSTNSRTIGVDDIDTGNTVKEVYSSFCRGEMIVTTIKTAEMTKVVENTFRDINIAFANELTKICNLAELDVYEIIGIANKHPRVNILSPGPGVGGHCISVDPWFLVGDYPGLANLILTSRKINDSMPEYVLEKVSKLMSEYGISNLSRVGFYGITYKENIDDIRESPTLQLYDCMKRHAATGAIFYDPYAKQGIIEGQTMDFDKFLSDVDIVVIMVGHKEIIEKQHRLKDKIVFDTRNVLDEIETIKL